MIILILSTISSKDCFWHLSQLKLKAPAIVPFNRKSYVVKSKTSSNLGTVVHAVFNLNTYYIFKKLMNMWNKINK